MTLKPHSRSAEAARGILTAVFLCLGARAAGAEDGDVDKAVPWNEHKSRHFVVYYRDDSTEAAAVSAEAERLYLKIASDIGISRRDNFWIWEERVKIYIYDTRDEFIVKTAAPKWAGGKAVYSRREISTYGGSKSFLGSVLPHEMTHLMFKDFVGFKGDVPLWLDEGIAQWEESGRRAESARHVQAMFRQNRLLPLDRLAAVKAWNLDNGRVAADFYAQSASLVGYLIAAHSPARFLKFCGQIRDGKTPDEALRFTYPETIRSIELLEEAWRKHVEASMPPEASR